MTLKVIPGGPPDATLPSPEAQKPGTGDRDVYSWLICKWVGMLVALRRREQRRLKTRTSKSVARLAWSCSSEPGGEFAIPSKSNGTWHRDPFYFFQDAS